MPNDSDALKQIARNTPWFHTALCAVRELKLDAWCIGAGAVRNLVWDALHGHVFPSPLADIDVAFFDASCLDSARDTALERQLRCLMPDMPWEVTNQASVHHWFEAHFGHAVPPLNSLEEAVGSWPEFATAVGVTLRDDDTIDVIAPHGLSDLFQMIVRRNPARVSLDSYRQRIAQKQYATYWPNVTIIP
ncbi:MAG: nucleotidyltransferase family protein [Burkholderiales bacterium]|nr:nucleotidyltransferase family protein [Burkholderiales bacterium]